MYKNIIRPILFMINPETTHGFTVASLKILRHIPFGKYIADKLFTVNDKRLQRNVLGLMFRNPVGIAAGLDKNAECFDMLSHMGPGFIEVGTVTPVGQQGNPKPRLFRLPKDKALINRMGFNNNGAEECAKNISKLRKRCAPGTIIGGNVGKNTATDNTDAPKDYLKAFETLYGVVDYFTVNVSCPNVTNLCGLQSRDGVSEILRAILEFREKQPIRKPIFLKISSDLSEEQIKTMVDVVRDCGIDGMVAVNTTTSREGLLTENVEAIGRGGLSGGPLTERSIKTVKLIHEYSGGSFPIIGVGGIMTSDDAVRMIEAGASLIQIFTGYIYNGPAFPAQICKAILKHVEI